MKKIFAGRLVSWVIPLIVIAIVFAVSYPLVSKINFSQNDDFYYYSAVKSFMSGNFVLPEKMAPTFYIQDMMGVVFSGVFGIDKLPFLTLLVSLSCVFVFFKILGSFFQLGKIKSAIFAFLLFFNPLFQYSTYGFMTENYLILFLLLSYYFWYSYLQTPKKSRLILCDVFIVLGFFIRQVMLVVPIAVMVYFLIQKKYKEALAQFSVFALLVIFYYFIFPQTVEMQKKALQFHHILEPNYAFAVIYGILLYLSAFLWPLLFPNILKIFKLGWRKIILWLGISFLLFILLNSLYQPMSVSWGEFPFFENVFERTGFLPRDLNGTKYFFRGNFDLYRYWESLAKTVLSGFLASLFFTPLIKRFIKDPHFYLIIVYCGLMLVTYTFYDRYILFLIPSAALLLLPDFALIKKHLLWVAALFFSVFLMYFTYFLANDYVRGLNLVWTSACELQSQGIPASKIYANRAWNTPNNSLANSSDYIFSYDSPEIKPDTLTEYKLIKEIKVDFPLNPYINSKIYLYGKN